MPTPRAYTLSPDLVTEISRRNAQRPVSDHSPPQVDTTYAIPSPFEWALIEELDEVDYTAEADNDTFTAVAHGMSNGQEVIFRGTPPAPLVAGVTYFVRDVAADTFKVAATSGGAAIVITEDGSGTFVISFEGCLHWPATRQDYDQYVSPPAWTTMDGVYVIDPNGRDLTPGEFYPCRRHGDAGPVADRRVLYSTTCCDDESTGSLIADLECIDGILYATRADGNYFQVGCCDADCVEGGETICNCPACPDGVPQSWSVSISGFLGDIDSSGCDCTQADGTYQVEWSGVGIDGSCNWQTNFTSGNLEGYIFLTIGGDFAISVQIGFCCDGPCTAINYYYTAESASCCAENTLNFLESSPSAPPEDICDGYPASVTVTPVASCIQCP